MAEFKRIVPVLIGLVTFGLIGLYIYNKIQFGGIIGTTPIIAFILIGFGLYAGINLLAQFGTGKFDLDNIFLPLIILGAIITAFIYVPNLITNTFSIVDSTIQPVQSPLSSFNFQWWHLLIPFGFILFYRPWRQNLVKRLGL